MLVVLGVAVHVLLPQVDELRRTLGSLRDARWWYLPPAVACAALTFPAAACSLAGATSRRLPFGTTVEASLASACLGRIAPANLGSLGVTGAYLHALGATVGETTATLGLDAVAGVVVHLVLLVAAGVLVGPVGTRERPDLDLPTHLPVVVTVAQIACLGTSVMAFGGRVGVVTVAFVYLPGAAVSAVAPTPGGEGVSRNPMLYCATPRHGVCVVVVGAGTTAVPDFSSAWHPPHLTAARDERGSRDTPWARWRRRW